MDYWIKSHPSHLNRMVNQGTESNHSSNCVITSFGGFLKPVEQLVQCLGRRKDAANKLNINRWEPWTEALQKVPVMRQNNDTENYQALLQLSPEGMCLWNEPNRSVSFIRRILSLIFLVSTKHTRMKNINRHNE